MSTTTGNKTDLTSSINGFQAPEGETATTQLVSDWKRGRLWHSDAPPPLKKAWKDLDEATAWKRWTTYLTKRKTTPPFRKFPLAATDPITWGVPITPEIDDTLAWRVTLGTLISSPQEAPAPQLRELLEPAYSNEIDSTAENIPHALRLLTLGYWLPRLARHLSMSDWWRLTTHLINVSRECQLASTTDASAEAFVVATLLGGELPLALSCLLPEIKPLRELRSPARITLSEGICEATDGEGLVASPMLPYLPLLFSSWTRCLALGRALPKGCWTTEADAQYEWLVRQTLVVARGDGTPLLTETSYRSWPGGPVDAALSLGGDASDRTAAAVRLGKHLLAPREVRNRALLPEASVESEWSMLAVMSGGWDNSAPRFAIDYSHSRPNIELQVGGKTVVAGAWDIAVNHNGKSLQVASDWEQQCWFSNDECDYLELAVELTGNARLERQILLGKEDDFLMFHDILHGEREGEWGHTHRWSLASGIDFQPEAETRDGLLVNAKGKAVASVLPLNVPEWRIDSRPGELEQQEAALVLTHHGVGLRGSAPVWFDLRPKRVGKPRTWRQLTVAASLEVAPRDVAVGYRVQTGGSQWLIYRSLAPPANRTVLGQNTSSESLIGRFLKTGGLDVLVEVDPA